MMKFPGSLHSPKPHRSKPRRPFCQQDMIMYEALVGKRAELPSERLDVAPAVPSGENPVQTVATRWTPNMARITDRLRSMYEQGNAKRPQVTDWLKNISDQAISRLDEAQARLSAARPGSPDRHRVGRVILTVRPQNGTRPAETALHAGHGSRRVA